MGGPSEFPELAFSWVASSWWLEILWGYGIGTSIFLTQKWFTENNVYRHPVLYFVIYGLCVLGVWRAGTGALNFCFGIEHGLALVVAFVVNLSFAYNNHVEQKKRIESNEQWYWFTKVARLRRGYYELRGPEYEQVAGTTRFGLVFLGRSPSTSFWQKLTGRDGWTDKQRKAVLRHEMGHNIIGVPALAAETLLHYYFCVWLVDSWTWPALLLVPILLAAVTLLSWAEELFCDGLSGVYGLSLYPVLFKGSGLRVHLLGGTGCYSHPPVVLRLMAQAAAPLSMVGIIAYWFLAN